MTQQDGPAGPYEMSALEREMHVRAMNLADVAAWLARTAHARPGGQMSVASARLLTLVVKTPDEMRSAIAWLSTDLESGEVIKREISMSIVSAVRSFNGCDVAVIGTVADLCTPIPGDVPGWQAPAGFLLDPMAAEMSAYRLDEESQQFEGTQRR